MANDQAPEPADFFGPDAIAVAAMMHLVLQSKRFHEGDFRAGWEAAIEEAAAYLDDQAGDDRTTLQTLMEQVINLMQGSYALVEVEPGPCRVELEHMEKAAEMRARNRRADASPLPPPGSAGEAEMVERALRAFRNAVISGERVNNGAMLAALRAAFGGSGAAGEESGDA